MKIILYISNFNPIGGVERFVLNFYKRFPETIVLYDNGNPSIGEKINWHKIYNCDLFISASAWGQSAFDNIEAKIYIQMVHADYRVLLEGWKFEYKKHWKTTHHICVSETVKKGFEEVTPYKCDAVFYNFIDDSIKPLPKHKNDILRLVTISRISHEKGFERMAKFAKLIPVPFVWEVWGNANTGYAKNAIKDFNFKGITNTPHLEIAKADYVVQLSDSEGNCCIINESLQMHTPVLLTPFPSGYEQVEDGVNGYRIPFDLNNIDWDSITNNIPVVKEYKEKTTVKDWLKFFNFALNNFHMENKLVKVRVLKQITNGPIGSIIEISQDRATAGIDRGLIELVIDIPVKTAEEKMTEFKTKTTKNKPLVFEDDEDFKEFINKKKTK